MRRTLLPLPLAAAGLSLALAASADPPVKKPAASRAGQTSATASKKKTRKAGKHMPGALEPLKPHPTIATAMRNWGDNDVAEGTLGQATPGAVCPSEMANVDDR